MTFADAKYSVGAILIDPNSITFLIAFEGTVIKYKVRKIAR
jgi:hypothetical protein